MKLITKALVGTIVGGALIIPALSPAMAQGWQGRDNNGPAAPAGNHDNDRGGNFDYGRAGFDRNGGPSGPEASRRAVEICTDAAQTAASRRSYGPARVTDIRSVSRSGRGFTVKGRIAVNAMGHDWRQGDHDRGRGWNGNDRGWDNGLRGYDNGSFTCKVEFGRIVKLGFSGIRGL